MCWYNTFYVIVWILFKGIHSGYMWLYLYRVTNRTPVQSNIFVRWAPESSEIMIKNAATFWKIFILVISAYANAKYIIVLIIGLYIITILMEIQNTLKGFKKFTAILFIIVKPASKALLMKFELTSFTHWKYYANYYESIFEVECILISYKCCYPMFPSFHRQVLKSRFLNTNDL